MQSRSSRFRCARFRGKQGTSEFCDVRNRESRWSEVAREVDVRKTKASDFGNEIGTKRDSVKLRSASESCVSHLMIRVAPGVTREA
jgi:hypothetical protein